MKFLILFLCTFSFAVAVDEFCYNDVIGACSPRGSNDLLNCDAKYGAINDVLTKLQNFVNNQITYSFHYLLISTHFANYQQHRVGFEKLFRQLSDTTWNDGIQLIQYITNRGGVMNFTDEVVDNILTKDDSYAVNEIASLGRALDISKALNQEATNIHNLVTRAKEDLHDPEISSHIENFFLEKYRQTIRELSGHTSDVVKFLDETEKSSLAMFLFDEYLQKE